MQNYFFILIFLCSFSLLGMQKDVNKKEAEVFIYSIPHELLSSILEKVILEHFREINRKHLAYNHPCLWNTRDVKQFLKRNCVRGIYKEVISFVGGLKLVSKPFFRTVTALTLCSTFDHFPRLKTWFLLSLSERNYDMAAYLLGCQIDSTVCDDKGRNCLIILIKYSENETKLLESGMLELLLAHQVDPSALDFTGRNALFYAIANDQPLIVEWLIEHGVPLNGLLVENKKSVSCKKSPLEWAICYQSANVVRLLLRKGAHVSFLDAKGKSMIEYARKQVLKNFPRSSQSRHIVEILEDKEEQDLVVGGASFCVLI